VPTAAVIGTNTGIFSWTPDESQGPSTNHLAVVVSDNGAPPLSATQNFTVIVLETNAPPVLAPIENRTVYPGTLLTFTNTATDADIPTNTLTFSLEPGAPLGAAVNVTKGVFTWTPTDAAGNTTNTIGVRVTDDGVPPHSDTRTFQVTVLARPRIASVNLSGNDVSLIWSAVPGGTYRVQYKTNVFDAEWTELLPDIIATGSTATNTETLSADEQRVYRVRVVLPE
jgi:hypothetical protein